MSTTNGTWVCGVGTVSYNYEWLRDGTVIPGQTASTHVVVAADLTHLISTAVQACDSIACSSYVASAESLQPLDRLPNAPSGLSPANGTVLGGTSATLSSTFSDPDADESGYVTYSVYRYPSGPLVATGNGGTVVSGNASSWTTTLPGGDHYYYTAQAVDYPNTAIVSSTVGSSSTTGFYVPPSVPTLQTPANQTTPALQTVTPALTAAASSVEPIYYEFQVAPDAGFATVKADSGFLYATGTWAVPPGALQDGQTYYWRVRAEDTDGATSGWSAVWSFSIQLQKLGVRDYWPLWSHGPLAVNEANGNLVLSLPTPSYPTAVGSLGLSLTYNSRATTSSPGLGTGWTLVAGDGSMAPPTKLVDHNVVAPTFAAAEIVWPDGSSDYYSQVGNSSTYLPATVDGTQLTKNPDGTWTLLDSDGTTYTFGTETSGVSLLDKAQTVATTGGNGVLTYGYAAGKISSLSFQQTSTSSPETLSFTWNCSGGLLCVTGPDGKTWTYTANASNQITGVSDSLPRQLMALTYTGGLLSKVQNADDLDPTHASPGYNAQHSVQITYIASNVSCVTDGPISSQTQSSQPSCAGGAPAAASTWSFNYTPTCPALKVPSASHSLAQGTAAGCTTRVNPNQQPSGPGITVLYDNLGRPLERDDARLGSGKERITLSQYNAQNQLAWGEDADGNPTDYSYDPVQHVLLSMTGPSPAPGQPRPVTSYRYDEQTLGTANTPGNPLTGLAGSYWTNTTSLVGLPAARETDPAPGSALTSFSFAAGSGWVPSAVSGNTSGFSARWSGTITIPSTGDYTFTTTSYDASNGHADGTQLVVDGVDAIENLTSPTSPTASQAIHLSAGGHQLRLEYAHSSSGATGANLTLEWACADCSPSIGTQAIPITDLAPTWENQTSVVTPAGRISFQHYATPQLGHADYSLVKLADGTNLITSYLYDSLGRLTSKYMPKANASSTIDPTTGNLSSTPDTNYETDYTYYGDGATAAPPNAPNCSGTAVNQYGRLQTASTPNGGLHSIVNVYDLAGNTIATTNAAGTTCSDYDNENRLTNIQAPGDALRTSYTYDPNGTQLTATGTDASYLGEFGRATSNTGSLTKTITLTGAPGAGAAVFLRIANTTTAPSATAVTDSRGNTWTLLAQGTVGVPNSLYATLQNTAPLKGGDIVTVTWSTNVTGFAGVLDAFAGVSSLTPDKTATASSSTNTTARNTGTTATTTQAPELQIASWGVNAVETAFTPTSGASQLHTPYLTNSSQTTTEGEYKFVNTTGAYNLNSTGGVSATYNGFIVTLPALPRHSVTTYYDEEGRPVDTIDSKGAEAASTYDPDGNPVSRIANKAALGQPRTCPGSPNYCTTYSYDPADQLTSETDSAGRAYSFFYDNRGNLRGTQYPNSTFSWVDTNPAGWISDQYNRHGTITANTTTPPSDSSPLADYTYTYDADGKRLTELRTSGSTSQNTTYTYDNLGRLTQAGLPNNTCRQYGYDLDSNRSQIQNYTTSGCTGTPTAITYTYNPSTTPGLDELTSIGSTNYAYTSDGQTASQGTTSYTWDGWSRLKTTTVGTNTVTYTYDPTGALKTRASISPSSTTNYLLGDLFETNSGGTITTSYTDGPAGNLASFNGPPTTSSTVTYLYYDAHGNLAAEANSSGTITGNHTCDPFGAPADAPPSNTTVHRFTGRWDKQYDTTSGLILMGVRPYDPTTGRFLSVDPVPGGSLNNYDYADQDPVNNYDLAGTMAAPDGEEGAGLGAIGGVEDSGTGGGIGDVGANQGLVFQVASETGGEIRVARSGKGWRINVGKIRIRIMNSGSGNTNYFRISVEGKGSLNAEGRLSNDRAATHMKITQDAFERIMRILRRSGYYHD